MQPPSSVTSTEPLSKPKPSVTALPNPLLARFRTQKPSATLATSSDTPPGLFTEPDAALSHTADRPQPPSTRQTGEVPTSQPRVQVQATPTPRAQPVASSRVHPPTQPSRGSTGGAVDPEARQRAADRAHNAAILAQLPDEDVARSLAEADGASQVVPGSWPACTISSSHACLQSTCCS